MEEESRKLIESDIKTLIQQKVLVDRFSDLIGYGVAILGFGVLCLFISFGLEHFFLYGLSYLFLLIAPALMILGAFLASLGAIVKIIKSGVYDHELSILRSRKGEEMIVDSLISLFKDKNSKIREVGAEILDDFGWVPSSENERIYYLIAKQEWNEILNIGKPAVEHLIRALKDEDKYVRWYIADALGKIGEERAIESLSHALKDENEEFVREAAKEALEKIKAKKS